MMMLLLMTTNTTTTYTNTTINKRNSFQSGQNQYNNIFFSTTKIHQIIIKQSDNQKQGTASHRHHATRYIHKYKLTN